MPMDFPNMESLKWRAEQRDFRQPLEGETEDDYRKAFADYMRPIDMIESMEIRIATGWDRLPIDELAQRLKN